MDSDAEAVRSAAAALKSATHLLVGAGAGMSADSGLRTYAEAMTTQPQAAALHAGETVAPMTYHDLCQPSALLQHHRAAAVEFWRESVCNYRTSVVHDGYNVLSRWCESRGAQNTCVYTSNVDGLFRRHASLRANLVEIHGCVEEWMCTASLGFARDADGALRDRGGLYAAHNEAVRAAATRLGGSTAEISPWSSACEVLRVTPPWARPPPYDDAAAGNAIWRTAEPACPACALPLRPCVVMFNDTDEVLLRRQARVAEAYQEWEEAMEASVAATNEASLVVLEIGCGLRVPSVRRECEDVVRDVLARGGRAVLIRINPQAGSAEAEEGVGMMLLADGAPPPLGREHVITIRDGARHALCRIDEEISRL